MTCLNCTHIKTHNGGKAMFRQGFSGCAKQLAWEYFSYAIERVCADFAQASSEQMAKRVHFQKGRP